MRLSVTAKQGDIAYHRNGVGGRGFYVVLFDYGGERMVGVVFDEPGECAVLGVEKLAAGDIEFGQGNSWRGDVFEDALRANIATYERTCAEQAETARAVVAEIVAEELAGGIL